MSAKYFEHRTENLESGSKNSSTRLKTSGKTCKESDLCRRKLAHHCSIARRYGPKLQAPTAIRGRYQSE